jgi:hypothetical protein
MAEDGVPLGSYFGDRKGEHWLKFTQRLQSLCLVAVVC